MKGFFQQTAGGRTVAALVFLLLATSACNEYGELGDDVTSTLAVEVDSIPIYDMRNVQSDTLFTDIFGADRTNGRFSTITNNVVGEINDPILGRLTARTYLDFTSTIGTPPTSFGFDVRLDSVVMQLRINSRYGESTPPQIIDVRELADTMQFSFELDSLYKITDTRPVLPTPVATRALVYRDTVASRDFVLRLPIAFGQRILGLDPKVLGTDSIAKVLRFKGNHLRGFEITTRGASGQPGALFNIQSTSGTNISIYYRARTVAGGTLLSQSITFTPDYLAQRFTSVQREFAGTLADTVANSALTDPNTRVYLQGLNNQTVKIRLPQLASQLPNVLVSAATLVVYVDPQSLQPRPGVSVQPPYLFDPPQTLNLYIGQESDSNRFDTNLLLGQGNYNARSRGYEFQIRAGIQYLLGDITRDAPLFIVPVNRQQSTSRVVLATQKHANPALRPRLRIIYSPQPR